MPPEAVEYLRQHGVLDVLDLAWPNLVAQKPADPLGFLLEQVSSSNSWTEVASMDIDQGSPDLSIVSVCDFFWHLFLQTPVGKSMDLGSRYFGTFVNFKDFPTSVGKFVQNHKIVILDRSRMIALGYVVRW